MRRKRATPFFDRRHAWTILVIATLALLSLPSGLKFPGPGKPAQAAPLSSSVLQQKSPPSKATKPTGRIDPKSVLAAPGITQTVQPPPQPPRFQVSFAPQSVRVGETVTFSLQPVNLVQKFASALEIDFGDKTPRRQLEAGRTDISHWYSAEGPYTVAVYPRVLRSARFNSMPVSDPLTVQVGSWSLSPLPASVEIGEQVSFAIDHPSTDRSIEYQFHLGDDSPASGWVSQSQATHRYHSAATYKPFVEIRRVIDKPMSALATTTELSIIVKPLPQSALRLDLETTSQVQVRQVVTFTATLVSKLDQGDLHLRYNFDFGENGSKRFSGWQPGAKATHLYLSAGTYPAKVEVAWFNEPTGPRTPITQSEAHEVFVVPATQVNPPTGNVSPNTPVNPPPGNRPPRWKWYPNIIIPALAVIVLAILFAGYQTLKGRFSVKPDYRAHRDIGVAQMKGGSLAIEFDLRLKPDVTEARYQLDVPEAGLIRYERRLHE